MTTIAFRLLPLLAASLLAACGQSNESELKQWMGEVRAGMKPTTQPVPPPKEFVPAQYEARSIVESSPAADKQFVLIRHADHYGFRILGPHSRGERVAEGGEALIEWLRARFPA